MMNKFKHRSYQSELLDAPDIPKSQLIHNLHELDFISRALGGHAISLNGIKELVTDKNKVYHIVDLGCGSGDLMQYIAKWAAKEGYKVKLTGVDRNPDVINYLNNYCKDFPEITGVASDYRDYLKTGVSIDVIHSSLFCHHLTDDELSELFGYCKVNTKIGFVINDLHRHWIAYYGVHLITHLFNGTALSKNDGPISVLRAFKVKELRALLKKAGITGYSIHWKWAFRYLVVGHSF
ncbi:MAG: methyltransferase domain-containing protein [Mariniphaga sp.]|nr:methyltransferase domain-containing protein [Mariniphaga sp.]